MQRNHSGDFFCIFSICLQNLDLIKNGYVVIRFFGNFFYQFGI
jgi:hypothetical protein